MTDFMKQLHCALTQSLTLIKQHLFGYAKAERFESTAGWVVFLATLVWFYQVPPWMWHTHLHAGGDVIEAVWQASFWRDVLLSGSFDPVSREMVYPVGAHQFVEAHVGPGFLLLPVSLGLSSVVAVNVGFVGGFVLCFLGARRFLRFFTPSHFIASIGATAFTFALGRTFHIFQHLHVSLGSTAIVWLATALLALREQPNNPRAWMWAAGGGVCWAIAIIAQPYFVFLGAPLMLLLAHRWQTLRYTLIVAATASVISAPFLFLVNQGATYMRQLRPVISELAYFGSKPQDYVGWGQYSFWTGLAQLSKSLRNWSGEQSFQNWGIGTLVFSAIGAALLWRRRAMRVLILLILLAATLSFGPFWQPIRSQPAFLQRLNNFIWEQGIRLKPAVFTENAVSLSKSNSLPLPGILPVMLLPRYEFARVAGRYSILVSLIAVALVSVFLTRIPKRGGVVLGCLWLIELLPMPRPGIALPATPHPAHKWASRQLVGQESAIFITSPLVRSLPLLYSGYLANRLPSANMILSFVPEHLSYMLPWFFGNPSEVGALLSDPGQVAWLRRAQVKIIFTTPDAVEAAKRNHALQFVRCFESEAQQRRYYPALCAFEVLPDPEEFFTILPITGFSTFEPRWVWIEGTYAQAGWWIDRPSPRRLDITLRAYCPPEGEQTATIKLNGQLLTTYHWIGNCWEAQHAQLTLAARQLRSGLNRLEIEAASAAQPYLYDPQSRDRRHLSILVEQLRLTRADSATTQTVSISPALMPDFK